MLDYQVGGSLSANNPTYIEREADRNLYAALLRGELCYVLTSRQMGKSSLRLRTRHRLETEARGLCVSIDMTRIGSENITPDQWYQGIAFDLLRSLKLHRAIDLTAWWNAQGPLSAAQKLGLFLEDVVLTQTRPEMPIFIFIDEIDSVQCLNFPVDDFFALVRYCHNQRAENPLYQRLVWALFGVASPADLITDPKRTPFNVGRAIALPGVTFAEAAPLLPGLERCVTQPQRVLTAILEWTGGQPFLTQKVCALVQQTTLNGDRSPISIPLGQAGQWVEAVVRSHIIANWQVQDEPEHLRTIQRFILHQPPKAGRLLGLYQQILTSTEPITVTAIAAADLAPLLLSGLVVQRAGGLQAHNRIYSEVFNPTWVKQQLTNLRPYAIALDAWVKSNYQDDTHLLRSRDLFAAQAWSKDKSLSDLDYQFLAASQQRDLHRRERHIVQILAVLNYRTGELAPYLKDIARAVSELITLDSALVTLCWGNEELVLASSLEDDEDEGETYTLHQTLTGYVFQSGDPLIVEDTETCTDYGAPPEGYRSYLGVPLKLSTGEVVGTICGFQTTPRKFTPDEVQLASIFAERAASAIENYRLYQQLQTTNATLTQQLNA